MKESERENLDYSCTVCRCNFVIFVVERGRKAAWLAAQPRRATQPAPTGSQVLARHLFEPSEPPADPRTFYPLIRSRYTRLFLSPLTVSSWIFNPFDPTRKRRNNPKTPAFLDPESLVRGKSIFHDFSRL